MTVRERINEEEKEKLSPYAMHSCDSKGRMTYVEPCTLRTEFQRDRDRITHSKAFRRLMHKTQVFVAPEDDHFRTRLTHTLEVTQIARTIARAVSMNEDLCEAIGLGHDLGHTPFGHAGERVLQRCYDSSFSHNSQSLRVVDVYEKLNLTYEVRDGILNHVWGSSPATLEGRIVQFADRIAYINHDIDDACRAGVITPDDIPSDIRKVLGGTHSARINTMVTAVIESSIGKNEITMEPTVLENMLKLRKYLFDNVYFNSKAKGEEKKAELLVEKLYYYFCDHPDELPDEYKTVMPADGTGRAVCDFISGMTDRYAISMFEKLFVPQPYGGLQLTL